MESPGRRSMPRRHKLPDAFSTRRIRRSDSNISSTSSDIQVASNSQAPPDPTVPKTQQSTSHPSLRRRHVTAVVKRRILVVRNLKADQFPLRDAASLDIYTLNNNDSTMAPLLMPVDDQEGPNHRGTYSKAYTLRHPEFTWTHRGQGRYLPSSSVRTPEIKKEHGAVSPKSLTTPKGEANASLHRNDSITISQGMTPGPTSGTKRGSLRNRRDATMAGVSGSRAKDFDKSAGLSSGLNWPVALNGDEVFNGDRPAAPARLQYPDRNGSVIPSNASQPAEASGSPATLKRPASAMEDEAMGFRTDQRGLKRSRISGPEAADISQLINTPEDSIDTPGRRKWKAMAPSELAPAQRSTRRQRLDRTAVDDAMEDSADEATASSQHHFVDGRRLVRQGELTADENNHIPRRQFYGNSEDDHENDHEDDHEPESDEWEGFSENGKARSDAVFDINSSSDARESSTRAGARRPEVARKATRQRSSCVDNTPVKTPLPRNGAGRAEVSSYKDGVVDQDESNSLHPHPYLRLRSSRSINKAEFVDEEEEAIYDDEEDTDQEDDIADDGDDGFPQGSAGISTDPNGVKTFSRDVVEAILAQNPGQKFYHTGNGWWKKGSRPRVRGGARRRDTNDAKDATTPVHATTPATRTRAQRTPAQPPAITAPTTAPAAAPGLNNTQNYSRKEKDDLKRLYPDREFYHAGGGHWREGPAPPRKLSQARSASATVLRRARGSAVNDVEDEDSLFTPEVNASGRLRSRRMSTGFGLNGEDQDPEEDQDEEDQDEEIEGDDGQDVNHNPEKEQLYLRDYVDAHPHLEFHHHGQGRFAQGRTCTKSKTKRSKAPAAAPAPPPVKKPEHVLDPNKKFPTSYVDKHPNITFHHKGQGRWVMGMPDRNAPNYNKIAIRGPGQAFRDTHQAEEPEEESDNDEIENYLDSHVRVPGPTTLLVKSQTEQWPQFTWHYIGGGKWSRSEKRDYDRLKAMERSKESADKNAQPGRGVPKRKSRGDVEGPEAQSEREAEEAEHDSADVDSGMQQPLSRRVQRAHIRGSEAMPKGQTPSKTSTPKPAMLEPEEDVLADADLPSYYGDTWGAPTSGGTLDAAAFYMRDSYLPINGFEEIVASLEKFDPAIRPLSNLKALASHAQAVAQAIQDEYLELDKIVAPHSKVARKPAKGGRLPVEPEMFEDQKEAVLYDYEFDKRKIGFQDPEGQKTLRDADGRELRKRRIRGPAGELLNGIDPTDAIAVQQTGMFGQPEKITGKRAVRPVSRFDGVVADAGRKRKPGNGGDSGASTPAPVAAAAATVSSCPGGTSVAVLPAAAYVQKDATHAPQPVVYGDYVAPTKGRWAGHVPKAIVRANKRVEELKRQSGTPAGLASTHNNNNNNNNNTTTNNNSAGGADSAVKGDVTTTTTTTAVAKGAGASASPVAIAAGGTAQRSVTPGGTQVRKGRPPGSKNLHKRKDAGIPKGPRKPKKVEGEGETGTGGRGSGGGGQAGGNGNGNEGRVDVGGGSGGDSGNGNGGAVVDTIE